MATRVMKNHERRKHPRANECLSFVIRGADAEFAAETSNLSASGAHCSLDRFIAPMTKLELRFSLPGGARRKPIRCSAVVVRVEPVVATPERMKYNVALFFTEILERDRKSISRFVQRRLGITNSPH